MTPPTLLEAAKEYARDHVGDPTEHHCGSECLDFRALRAAIAVEEAKPKVERTLIASGVRAGPIFRASVTRDGPLWDVYAERPVPPPKEPSIEERLDELSARGYLDSDIFKEAAAEIRRLRGKQ